MKMAIVGTVAGAVLRARFSDSLGDMVTVELDERLIQKELSNKKLEIRRAR